MTQKTESHEEKNLWQETYQALSDVIICLIFVTILFVFAIRLVSVVGSSMYPTLHEGDKLTLLSNCLYEPKRGDVVVLVAESFEHGEPLVKRVIATEGQTVDIDFVQGLVWVDGVLQEEPYINEPTYTYEGVNFPITVPENCIFVMGDNRNASTDSRTPAIGCVDQRYVLGKALRIITPISRFGGIS